MNLAFNSKHPYVLNPQDPGGYRWIASLSDGTTVFEDITPGVLSAWHRLRQHIELHDLKVTNLRLEAYGRNLTLVPYEGEDGTPQINGYWYSKQIQAIIGGQVLELKSIGIGFVKGKKVFITWVNERGDIRQEERDYIEGDRATIINEAV